MAKLNKLVKLDDWVYENLKAMKIHPNQSFNEVIANLIIEVSNGKRENNNNAGYE